MALLPSVTLLLYFFITQMHCHDKKIQTSILKTLHTYVVPLNFETSWNRKTAPFLCRN